MARYSDRNHKVEVYRDTAGKWRWRFRASNGRILADSAEGYTTRSKAIRGAGIVCSFLPYEAQGHYFARSRQIWALISRGMYGDVEVVSR